VKPSSDILIRAARIEEIIDLRWTILRAGLARETANFDGDLEPATLHFAGCAGGEVIACASFMRREFENQPAWQLRGMAVRGDHQGGGIGSKLLDFAEGFIGRENHSNLLWCNARVPAARFYQRRGWKIVSEPFDVPTAGPHVRMMKMMKRIEPIVR
jgi:GNAT superfamily N-acetyltransferase